MNHGQLLAFVMMALSCAACVAYALAGDVRHAIYWGAAAVITGSVTL